jgi:hypothetical protein
MKITSLKDIQNIKKEYRVLGSTYHPDEETKAMIGGIYECASVDYKHNLVGLYNQDKSNWHWFNLSDVQELTPLEYNGRRIGIGDWVKCGDGEWYEVYGYHWYDGDFVISTAFVEEHTPDYNSCFHWSLQEIEEIKPLYEIEKENLSGKKVEVVIDGKTYKAVIE